MTTPESTVPAEVPMPEAMGTRFDGTKLIKEADVRQYGDAREAAGYARGLTDTTGEIARLSAELAATRYSLQLDESLIGAIQKIIIALSERPVSAAQKGGE